MLNSINFKYRLMIKFFYFFIIFGFYLLILNSPGKYDNDAVYITNSIIILYSLVHILADENRAYSAKKTFYLFIFFFMGIAPILQYKNGDETVTGYDIEESTYIITNILIIFVLVTFDIFYNYFYKYKKFKLTQKIITPNIVLKEKKIANVLLIISIISLICTIYYYKDSLYLLLLRGIGGVDLENKVESGNYLSPFFTSFIRPLAVASCVNYWCIGKRNSIKFILFCIMCITCFPTSLSRLRAAAYYLPLLIIIVPKLRYRNRYVILFSIGLLCIFPFLDVFRSFTSGKEISLAPNFDMFRTMHFDSYQSFAFVIQNNIITYGRQLMLVLFFWIPRTLWPSKPYMSGRMVADEYGLWFDQISMNYFGEGYINFGLLGVLIFSVALAYFTTMFDKLFWHYNRANIKSLFAPFYLFFIGIYFFFMRGDLMYGFQYTIMLLLANYFIYYIIKKVSE